MKLGFLLITGVFFNMFMGVIFPFQLLDTQTASSLLGGDTLGYDFGNNPYFGDNYKQSIQNYRDNTNADKLQALSNTDTGLISSSLQAISSFFDGLF